MQFSQRLEHIRSNVFADMDRAKARAKSYGKDLIDLSLGSSDLPAPAHAIQAIASSLQDPSTHGYLLFNGTQPFRQAAAQWYESKFNIAVDSETEVLPLIGCQEGTAHLPLAILNPGDVALLQDPGYPSHSGGVHLAGGEIYPMPMLAENGFLPVFADIPADILQRAKLMILSYPHNPTTAIAPLDFLRSAVEFCQKNNIVLIHDLPYVDLVFSPVENRAIAPSILEADPEKSVSIEFFTMSKSYSMGGFRVGFAIGNKDLILALRQVKACVDFNQYRGIFNGAIAALTGPQDTVTNTIEVFRERRDVFIQALHNIGWNVPSPDATMYIWAKLPEPWTANSVQFAIDLVEKTGVAVAPGAGFGKAGEGYVRFALVHEPPILQEAVNRIAEFFR
jgi:aspartate/methionine/tyrosine aminotransferase